MRCFISRWPDGSYSVTIMQPDAQVPSFARLLDQEDDPNEAEIFEVIPEGGIAHVAIPHEKKEHHGDKPFAYDGIIVDYDWPE